MREDRFPPRPEIPREPMIFVKRILRRRRCTIQANTRKRAIVSCKHVPAPCYLALASLPCPRKERLGTNFHAGKRRHRAGVTPWAAEWPRFRGGSRPWDGEAWRSPVLPGASAPTMNPRPRRGQIRARSMFDSGIDFRPDTESSARRRRNTDEGHTVEQESSGDQRRGARAPDNPGASNRHGLRRATQRVAPIGLKACRRNNRNSRIF